MSFLTGSGSSVKNEPITLQSSLSSGQSTASNILGNLLSGTGDTSYIQSLFPSYTGQVGAPTSTATTDALSGLTSNLGSATSAASGVPATTSTGLTSLSNVLSSQPQDLTSYFTSNIFNPTEQTLTQSTLPGIMSSAGGSVGGYESTSESNAVADAIGSAYSGMAGTAANTAYTTAQQNVTDKTNALNQLSTITGLPSSTLSTILGAGTTAQTAQQTSLSKAYSDYTQGLTNTQDFISAITDYLSQQTLTAANQYSATSGTSGMLGSILSGLGSALGKSNLFSGGSSGSGSATPDSSMSLG